MKTRALIYSVMAVGIALLVILFQERHPKRARADPSTWAVYMQDPSCTQNEQSKYNEVQDNARALSGMISDFTNVEKRYPNSWAELGATLFAAIRPGDVLNPYTGQPIQEVPQPSAGDMTWARTSNSLPITYYYSCGGQTRTEVWDNFDAGFLSEASTSDADLPDHLTDQRDKYAYMVCDYMGHYLIFFRANEGRMPNTFDEVKGVFPFLGRVRNEFTGGFAQDMPEGSPSPGNFTYKVSYDGQGNFDSYGLWCYGTNNEVVY